MAFFLCPKGGSRSLNITWILDWFRTVTVETLTELERSSIWTLLWNVTSNTIWTLLCSVQRANLSFYKERGIDVPSFTPTSSLTLLKNVSWKFQRQCWQLWQPQLWHNWRRRKYTILIHVTSDRDALTSSLSSMHPYRRPKDFISWDKEFLLERLMTLLNGTHRQIVTPILARLFNRLS